MKTLQQFILENINDTTDRTKRMTKTIKKKLFNIFGGCQICGQGTIGGSRQSKVLEVHHYNSRSTGGTETLNNSVLLCRDCHSKVHNNLLTSPKPKFQTEQYTEKRILIKLNIRYL